MKLSQLFRIIGCLLLPFLSQCTKKEHKKEFYENGNVKSEISILDNKYEGQYKTYYPSGKIKSITDYSNGMKNGLRIDYFESGKKEMLISYKNDIEDGKYTEWFEDGQIKVEGNFSNGKQNGLFVEYFESGLIHSERSFLNGIGNGSFKYYYPNGKIKMDAIQENDSTTYYQEFNGEGELQNRFRGLTIKSEADTIRANSNLNVSIFLYGPYGEGDSIIVSDVIIVGKGVKNKLEHIQFNSAGMNYSSAPLPKGKYIFNVNIGEKVNNKVYTYHASKDIWVI